MRIATGKVVDGKVAVEGEPLVEGATVAVLALDEDETFELSQAQEDELLVAIAQADRGEGMDGDKFLASLPRARCLAVSRPRINVVPQAQQHIRDAIRWWDEHRPSAPGAIQEGLRAAFHLIRAHPNIGLRSRSMRTAGVRRVREHER